MKIFADLHHIDLYDSLIRLFEHRLGFELFRPIGNEWWDGGYWPYPVGIPLQEQLIYVSQFLGMELETSRRFPWMNGGYKLTGNHYAIPNVSGRSFGHKAVTLEQFASIDFDVMLCSVPQHISPWKVLAAKYQPQAKLIFQAGNNWSWIDPSFVADLPNVMTSAVGINSPKDSQVISYHPEFSLKEYVHCDPADIQAIVSLQHYPNINYFKEFLSKLSPLWQGCQYGWNCPNGRLREIDVPNILQKCGFLWQAKDSDEGYGFNLHGAFAIGRPAFIRSSFHKNNTASILFADNKGSLVIDLDNGFEESIYQMENISSNYNDISDRIKHRFKDVVDFDYEFSQIKQFIENLR